MVHLEKSIKHRSSEPHKIIGRSLVLAYTGQIQRNTNDTGKENSEGF